MVKRTTRKTKRSIPKKKVERCDPVNWCKTSNCNSGGCIYFFGFLGAAVYYISQASGFWMGVLGFLKALVWPAFLVHALLKSLGM